LFSTMVVDKMTALKSKIVFIHIGKLMLYFSLTACTLDDPRENSLSASLVNTSLLTRSSAPINIPNTTLSNSINGKSLSKVYLTDSC